MGLSEMLRGPLEKFFGLRPPPATVEEAKAAYFAAEGRKAGMRAFARWEMLSIEKAIAAKTIPACVEALDSVIDAHKRWLEAKVRILWGEWLGGEMDDEKASYLENPKIAATIPKKMKIAVYAKRNAFWAGVPWYGSGLAAGPCLRGAAPEEPWKDSKTLFRP